MLDVSCRMDYTGAIKIMEVQCNMKLAFFDTKPYDKPGFDEHAAGTDIEIKYFETRLGEDTVQLAKGFDGVCVFSVRPRSFCRSVEGDVPVESSDVV